jgi:pimeloyl-ACP methyl ester carboxylesterase
MVLGSPVRLRRPVEVPTLYVWADLDRAVTRTAALRCRRFVEGPYTFVELGGASHWFPEETPDRVADSVVPHLDANRLGRFSAS